ncbi:Gti1/Pac2 family-domain-containing protein [Pyronema omphalodes]|nr:Gti1/Pac2 family-domain-containing protein [Pyronema omphalodes]
MSSTYTQSSMNFGGSHQQLPSPNFPGPSWQSGILKSSDDALVLMQCCINGDIPMVTRRPHDKEREDLIRSGNIFIYDEETSNIKRWTDSLYWSPSRIMGSFLVYREIEKAFPAGERKKAKKKRGDSLSSDEGSDGQCPTSIKQGRLVRRHTGHNLTKEEERDYCGSLLDSYEFKYGGLVKKTISLDYRGKRYHMVSYYNLRDVKPMKLEFPTRIYHGVHVDQELLTLPTVQKNGCDNNVPSPPCGSPGPSHQHPSILPPPPLSGSHYASSPATATEEDDEIVSPSLTYTYRSGSSSQDVFPGYGYSGIVPSDYPQVPRTYTAHPDIPPPEIDNYRTFESSSPNSRSNYPGPYNNAGFSNPSLYSYAHHGHHQFQHQHQHTSHHAQHGGHSSPTSSVPPPNFYPNQQEDSYGLAPLRMQPQPQTLTYPIAPIAPCSPPVQTPPAQQQSPHPQQQPGQRSEGFSQPQQQVQQYWSEHNGHHGPPQ